MIELQTPEQMLERWYAISCTCDPSVGHLCETCHDVQVLRDLLKQRDRLREALTQIADYGMGTERNDGVCPYGCDCPHIAQMALGIEEP